MKLTVEQTEGLPFPIGCELLILNVVYIAAYYIYFYTAIDFFGTDAFT